MLKRLLCLTAVLGACIALGSPAHAAFTGTLYTTNFSNHEIHSINVVNGLIVGSPTLITTLPGADGIRCAPWNHHLLIGGQQSNNVYDVNPGTGAFTTLNQPPGSVTSGAYHLKITPNNAQVWTSALYTNQIAVIDVATGATTVHTVSGIPNVSGIGITDPEGLVFLTDAPLQGGGSVYSLNTTTWTATKLLGPIPAAHGMGYDGFTGTFLLSGASQIAEWNYHTNTIVRTWDVSGMVGTGSEAHLDQGFTDNMGNFFVASNAGPVIYLDLTQPNPTPAVAGDLGFGLDDVAGCLQAPPPPPPPACANNAKTFGFWKHQCSTLGTHQVSSDSLNLFFRRIGGSNMRTFGPGGCFTAGCALLQTQFKSNMQGHAAQQFLTLLLNRAAGFVCDSLSVHCGLNGRRITVGTAIAHIDSLLCTQGGSTDFFAALNDLADCINSSAEIGGNDTTSTSGGRHKDSGRSSAVPMGITVAVGPNPVSLSRDGAVRFLVSSQQLAIATLQVFDAQGRRIAEPLSSQAVTGDYQATWDGMTLHGARAAAGTYFYRLTSGAQSVSGRFLIVK